MAFEKTAFFLFLILFGPLEDEAKEHIKKGGKHSSGLQ